MKLDVLIRTATVIFIIPGYETTDPVTKKDDLQSQCKPFNAFIIWHTGSGQDSYFYQQRRLLVVLIKSFPENTSVSIVTIGAKEEIRLHFRKQNEYNTNWMNIILNYFPEHDLDLTMSYREVQNELSNHHETNSNDAEIVYIVVNTKTVIPDKERHFEELRKKKTFIILSEIQTANRPQDLLLLATNNEHLVTFGSKDEDINNTKETIMVMSCRDSWFVCDTDMYWSSEGCKSCKYVCSSSCTEQPEHCIHVCPYFLHPFQGFTTRNSPKNESIADLKTANALIKESIENLGKVVFYNSMLASIIVLIVAVVAFVVYKTRRLLRMSINAAGKSLINRPQFTGLLPDRNPNVFPDIGYSGIEGVNSLHDNEIANFDSDPDSVSDTELKVFYQ